MLANRNVYEFRISLAGLKPKIWRRIQVPESYSFWDLHVAIQDVMSWKDCHMHQFEISLPRTGEKIVIGRIDEVGVTMDEREAKLKNYFCGPKDKATYLYDFELGWFHDVILERILPASADFEYPRCTAGKNPCFPENAEGDEIEEEFDHLKVIFSNPERHWNLWVNKPKPAM